MDEGVNCKGNSEGEEKFKHLKKNIYEVGPTEWGVGFDVVVGVLKERKSMGSG